MAAEAAIDINSAALQSNLQRQRTAARRQNSPRGQVFDFSSRKRIPFASDPKAGSSLGTPPALSTPPTAANNDLLFQQRDSEKQRRVQEARFQAKMLEQRQADKAKVQQYRMPELQNLIALAPEENAGELQAQAQAYEIEMAKLQEQQMQGPSVAQQAMSQAQDALREKAKGAIEDRVKKLVAKQGKDWGWRLFGRGGVVEVEGLAVWLWFGLGLLASMYQTGKLALGVKNLAPGILSFLEPSALNKKSIIVWGIDIPYSIVGYLILLLLFGIITIIVLIIIILAVSLVYTVSMFGSFGSFIDAIF